MGGTATYKHTDPYTFKPGTWGCAGHSAAEHAVSSYDTTNVGTVRVRYDTDVDDLILAVSLDYKWHTLNHRRSRVVSTEVADIEASFIISQRLFVGKVVVLIYINVNVV